MDSDKEDPGGGDERKDTTEASQDVRGDPDGVKLTTTTTTSPGGRWKAPQTFRGKDLILWF